MERKFKGWEKLQSACECFDGMIYAQLANTPIVFEVIYNEQTDEISFFEHVSENSYVQLDEGEIRLGYRKGAFDDLDEGEYTAFEYCKTAYEQVLEDRDRAMRYF